MASKAPSKNATPPPPDGATTGSKPSGKKAKILSQKEQSARFVEAARELEVDESGEAFDRALVQLLPSSTKNERAGNKE